MTAAAPLSCGATKLVPPQPVSSGLPWKPVKYSSKPVNGSALADRSGTPRPSREVPGTAAGCGWKIHFDGRIAGVEQLGRGRLQPLLAAELRDPSDGLLVA